MDSINYEELAKEVIKQQQNQEQTPQDHKEAVISVLREKTSAHQRVVSEPSVQPIKSDVQTAGSKLPEHNLPSYAESVSPEIQHKVEDLITSTLEKGLAHGIAQVAKADPFLIDMYHDALAEHLVGQLKERGML